jgi:hypothetical protein
MIPNRVRTNFELLLPVEVEDLESVLIYRLVIDRNSVCERVLRRRGRAEIFVDDPPVDQRIPGERLYNIRVYQMKHGSVG